MSKKTINDYKDKIKHFIPIEACHVFIKQRNPNHYVAFALDDGFEVGDVVCLFVMSTNAEYVGPIEKIVPLHNHNTSNFNPYVAIHSRSFVHNTTKTRLTGNQEVHRNSVVYTTNKPKEV